LTPGGRIGLFSTLENKVEAAHPRTTLFEKRRRLIDALSSALPAAVQNGPYCDEQF
jgi:hypothetical protein